VIGVDGEAVGVLLPRRGAAQCERGPGRAARARAPVPAGRERRGQQIFAGDLVPIAVSSGADTTSGDALDGTTGGTSLVNGEFVTSTNIERQDVGVDLRVKPTAVSDELVVLEIHLVVSSVAEGIAHEGLDPNQVGPTLREFEVTTTVRLVDGAIVLFGSAPQEVLGQTETGVPFLKDIPILGWRSRTRDVRAPAAGGPGQVTDVARPKQRADTILRRLALERARRARRCSGSRSPHVAGGDARQRQRRAARGAGRRGPRRWACDRARQRRWRWDVYLVDPTRSARWAEAGRAAARINRA
jgi:hypothetical protein